jgi:hypothetical protein
MNRHSSLGRKVATPFGTMHIGVSVDDDGRPCGMNIAPAQKLEQTSVGELVDALSAAADALMAEAIAATDALQPSGDTPA